MEDGGSNGCIVNDLSLSLHIHPIHVQLHKLQETQQIALIRALLLWRYCIQPFLSSHCGHATTSLRIHRTLSVNTLSNNIIIFKQSTQKHKNGYFSRANITPPPRFLLYLNITAPASLTM
eukprot:15329470-Ditylum_brightwellii.AAC.1